MRRVDDASELEAALERASSEAEAAFGDGDVYLEKFVDGPRHIEFQVMADAEGHTIHLGERECSIQRRHQKLVEESPAYGMTPDVRAAMGDAAVKATRAVGYVGAGTVEFLMDASGDWYFLEMNTRIQVEHPVTEAVTGVDLVQLQIRMAAGEKLEFAQEDVALTGHAIEVRIYAEDPDKNFIPSPGPIVGWRAPEGDGVRLDSGFEGGQTVTTHYDPMIAKLIVHADDRDAAVEKLAAALEDYTIAGIKTGLPFLRRVCENEVYRKGQYDTAFIEDHMGDPLPALDETTRDLVFAAVGRRAAREQSGATSFEIALPKSDALAVEVEGDVVTVDGRPIMLAVAEEEGPMLVATGPSGPVSLTLVPRKKGGYDVGLRDRVLRVKCEARG